MQPATQPARYCSPSSRSASVSIWGAAATNFSASAIASVRESENTPLTLERVPVLSQPRTFTRVVAAPTDEARSLRSALVGQGDQRLPHVPVAVEVLQQRGARPIRPGLQLSLHVRMAVQVSLDLFGSRLTHGGVARVRTRGRQPDHHRRDAAQQASEHNAGNPGNHGHVIEVTRDSTTKDSAADPKSRAPQWLVS